MNVTCNVIEDLLPLYTEKMVSEDTALLIQEHLASCSVCREKVKTMSGENVQAHNEIGNLPKLEKKLRQRRKMAALFAVLVTASLLLVAWSYLMGPVYMTWEEADVRWYYGDQVSYIYSYEDGVLSLPSDNQEGVSLLENGVLMLYMSPHVHRVSESRTVDPDSGQTIVTITAVCRRIDKLFPKEPFGDFVHTIEVDFDTLYYASLDGTEDTFVWGIKPDGGVQTLPRLVMGYYLLLALFLGVITGAAGVAARRKPLGKCFCTAGCWLLSFAVSMLLISGGQWPLVDSGDVPWITAWISVLASLMTGTLLCGWKTWRLYYQDRM